MVSFLPEQILLFQKYLYYLYNDKRAIQLENVIFLIVVSVKELIWLATQMSDFCCRLSVFYLSGSIGMVQRLAPGFLASKQFVYVHTVIKYLREQLQSTSNTVIT